MKLLPIDQFTIQEGYNDLLRTPKEVAANSKDVEKFMAAANDDPAQFPIQFVKDGKNKFVRNHASFLAAKTRGWKEIYAVELPHALGSLDDFKHLITSNIGGHKPDRVRQGHVYKAMLEGEPAGPDEVAAAKVGEEPAMKRAPMTLKEIADAMGGIITQEGIRLNVLLAESSPEIAELLEAGEVSGGVVIDAKKLAKDDDTKVLRIVKACIKNAKDDDRAKATGKDFDAVKEQFKPATKLIADGKKDKEDKAPEEDQGEDVLGLPAGGQAEAPEREEEAPEPQLFPQATAILTEGNKKHKTLIGALTTYLTDDEALAKIDVTMTLNPDEAERLAEELVKIVANAAEVF